MAKMALHKLFFCVRTAAVAFSVMDAGRRLHSRSICVCRKFLCSNAEVPLFGRLAAPATRPGHRFPKAPSQTPAP